jgi:TRAP transporter TAXI family solute receptor
MNRRLVVSSRRLAAQRPVGSCCRLALSAGLALSVALVGCQSNSSGVRYLSIATGGTGGVYYPYGGGIAKILNESMPGVRATAEVTSASVDNLKLIRDGRADLAFTLADTLAEAAGGRGPFAGRPVPVASLAVLYTNYTHVIALGSSDIRTIADLRGKVVATGSPGSGTEIIATRILRAAGLDPDADVTRQGLGVSESAGALKDGKIAAFFWSGGLPSAAVQDLAHTTGITIRMIPTGDLVARLQQEHGTLYSAATVPARSYPGIDGDVPVVGVDNVLVANASMPEPLAYDVTRLLFEKQTELAGIHPEARNLSLERAAGAGPAPFHPGAIRFYREKGVWKP